MPRGQSLPAREPYLALARARETRSDSEQPVEIPEFDVREQAITGRRNPSRRQLLGIRNAPGQNDTRICVLYTFYQEAQSICTVEAGQRLPPGYLRGGGGLSSACLPYRVRRVLRPSGRAEPAVPQPFPVAAPVSGYLHLRPALIISWRYQRRRPFDLHEDDVVLRRG
jgi:hypothetical protein